MRAADGVSWNAWEEDRQQIAEEADGAAFDFDERMRPDFASKAEELCEQVP